jgi:branched-chain amino acid transport system substrate-binding protein
MGLVQEHDVKLLLMLGGDTFTPVADYLMDRRILTSTLLPSDLSPDTPYLIAPSEVHPIYVVTGVDWLARTRPDLKTVAMCSQKDALGLPSLASYRAACKAADLSIAKEIQYDPDFTDVGAIVQPMLDENPDVLCWCTSYTPMVHAMTEYAYAQGFTGQILSCTLDHYERLVARTSVDFMEGVLFHFPDFDDPALNSDQVNFDDPNGFFAEFNERYPGQWGAVSWEYASIMDLWKAAAEKAGSSEPDAVIAAMKEGGSGKHAYGDAQWWGTDLFGIDNALVGDWPVVAIEGGKATIKEFRSIPDWYDTHGDLLVKHMQAYDQMWDQRG